MEKSWKSFQWNGQLKTNWLFEKWKSCGKLVEMLWNKNSTNRKMQTNMTNMKMEKSWKCCGQFWKRCPHYMSQVVVVWIEARATCAHTCSTCLEIIHVSREAWNCPEFAETCSGFSSPEPVRHEEKQWEMDWWVGVLLTKPRTILAKIVALFEHAFVHISLPLSRACLGKSSFPRRTYIETEKDRERNRSVRT